jgi:adenine-specific DNA-methyltransferase
MNEVFGEENFIAQTIWKGRQFTDSRALTRVSTDHEYIVLYAKSAGIALRGVERDETKFSNPDNDPRGPWMSRSILGLATKEQRPNLHYDVVDPQTGRKYSPPQNTGWRYSNERMQELIDAGCILFPSDPAGRPREKKFRRDLANEYMSFPSIIDDVFTAQGTAEIREIFGFQAYDFPKPSELIRRLVEQGTDKNDIVLDFFAGSATTPHAVFLQNRSDGGDRRCIWVQLPEPIGEESEIYRQGFTSIAGVGKERIRRVIKKLKDEAKGQQALFKDRATPEDLGFRVFKLAESNYRQWGGLEERAGEKYAAEMELFTDPLLPGSKAEDVVWEVALKEGYGLCSTVEEVKGIKGNRVWRVTDPDHGQSFLICLDDKLKETTVRALTLGKDDLFVCRDAALTDEQAANLALTCKLKTI